MKYNEAIGMILEGGRAYSDSSKEYGVYFYNDFLCTVIRGEEEINPPNLSKKDFTEENWIVEKDGVVYEEYPGKVISREMIVDGWKRNIPDGFVKVTLYAPPVELFKIPVTQSGYKKLDTLLESGNLLIDERGTPLERVSGVKILKSRTRNQDEPAELEEGGEPWEEIKMTIIAEEVNEDWLEKKMLCFMNKYLYIHSGMNLEIKQGQCSNRACPFCFPQEQPKEQPCEKVTVEDVMSLIYAYGNKNAEVWVAARANACATHDPAVKFWKDSRDLAAEKVKQKLTYLVSLQEKEK